MAPFRRSWLVRSWASELRAQLSYLAAAVRRPKLRLRLKLRLALFLRGLRCHPTVIPVICRRLSKRVPQTPGSTIESNPAL
ncbi:hypothetical protein B0H11DRAFT_1948357 [Mycena galericulata]|nr:hypothetical protein B0H11DRAFT_1948357 [Mycena galericulata]